MKLTKFKGIALDLGIQRQYVENTFAGFKFYSENLGIAPEVIITMVEAWLTDYKEKYAAEFRQANGN